MPALVISPPALNMAAPTVTVKQEREDDPEIVALAEKMRIQNEARMAQLGNRPVPVTPQQHQMVRPGQPSITAYYARPGNAAAQQQIRPGAPGAPLPRAPPPPPEDDEQALDINSKKGRFGWYPFKQETIPYIFRQDERFCAVRMVESKLLNNFLPYLPSDIVSCTCIRSYFITDDEARLLNEISDKHCNGVFSKDGPFTNKDLVVLLFEAQQFYEFLETCYRKLVLRHSGTVERCGFFRINNESVVPYTVKDGEKCVPLFYFEGETDRLKVKAIKVEGWELSYLKFCCKVQGIRSELFATDSCPVVSLRDIKQHFPSDTVFDEHWPATSGLVHNSAQQQQQQRAAAVAAAAVQQRHLASQNGAANVRGIVQNAQQQAAAINNLMSWSGAAQQQGSAAQAQLMNPMLQQVARYAVPATAANLVAAATAGHQLYTVNTIQRPPVSKPNEAAHAILQRQPNGTYQMSVNPNVQGRNGAVVHGTVQQASTIQATPYPTPQVTATKVLHPPAANGAWNTVQQAAAAQQQQQQRRPAASGRAPPPLLPMTGTPAASIRPQQQQQQQQQMAKQVVRPQQQNGVRRPAPVDDDVIDLSSPPGSPNGSSPSRQALQNSSKIPLHQIAEVSLQMWRGYTVQRTTLDNKQLVAIPMESNKPGSPLLIRVKDLFTQFFPGGNEIDLQRAIKELGASLYKLNTAQTQALATAQVPMPENAIVPMVLKADVEKYLLQLKYMMSRSISAAKRQRTE